MCMLISSNTHANIVAHQYRSAGQSCSLNRNGKKLEEKKHTGPPFSLDSLQSPSYSLIKTPSFIISILFFHHLQGIAGLLTSTSHFSHELSNASRLILAAKYLLGVLDEDDVGWR